MRGTSAPTTAVVGYVLSSLTGLLRDYPDKTVLKRAQHTKQKNVASGRDDQRERIFHFRPQH
jgi:hypothetical protein